MSDEYTHKKSVTQQNFENKRLNLTDREIQMEILYSNWQIHRKTEAVRSNTSKLVWFVVIGILLSLFGSFLASMLVL